MWLDHHDHERHVDYASDERFVLATKAQHGACPEMVTPARVRQAGPVDTILTHVDLDGLYAAAKWVLGGREPYPGADDDARAVDTRIGEPGPIARRIDAAVRARFRDDGLKRAIVWWLVDGMGPGVHDDRIAEAAAEHARRAVGTAALAAQYAIRGRVALVDAGGRRDFDKTDLLLAGQERAPVAIVRDAGAVSIAAPFRSGWDFVALLGLGGGMPTRVSVPDGRLDEAIAAINAAPLPRPQAAAPTRSLADGRRRHRRGGRRLVAAYLAPDSELEAIGSHDLPAQGDVAQVVEQARALLFPGYVGPGVARLGHDELRELVRDRLETLRTGLRRQVYRGLHHARRVDADGRLAATACADCAERAELITQAFIGRLPALRALAALDVRAAFEGDPAATSVAEVLFCYPGIYAVSVYRVAHALRAEGAAIVPRMMTELAHAATGIDIHPGARIGRAFFIDHGTGVVIGETSVIGDRVRIYQGVTLGALSVPRASERPEPGARRHPTIEDDVVIYAGATILGGDTVIGRGAVIGGNAWVTESVAPGARVAGVIQPPR
ncbi:MAG: serine O-acetyltransferase EpsC [Kofleriaceae bacterium]